MQQRLKTWRRDLHRIPEIGMDLPKTSAYLRNALSDIDAALESVGGDGLTLFFDLGFEDAIAFRADMDALVIAEINEVPYKSTHAGQMHACGHDAHMAMLLGFARWVDEHRAEMGRNVLLIFQPGEECCNGAKVMVDAGILERHHVVVIFALHVDPHLGVGQVGSRPGAFMARPSALGLIAHGKASHVARSEEGIDALAAGALFYQRVMEMVQNYHSRQPKLIKFGLMRAGSAANILADQCELRGTMRTFDNQDYDHMKRRIFEIAADIERETGARMEASVENGVPAVINDEALFAKAMVALADMEIVIFERPHLLGEDFSCYLARVPGVMFYIGVGAVPPLHAPDFDFDEAALGTGVELMQRLSRLSLG